jgi:hypothetical protein
VQALKGLKGRLWEMHQYLEAVTAGKMPVNRDIIALMQDIFNLLPNLNIQRLSQALTGALTACHVLHWFLPSCSAGLHFPVNFRESSPDCMHRYSGVFAVCLE